MKSEALNEGLPMLLGGELVFMFSIMPLHAVLSSLQSVLSSVAVNTEHDDCKM